MTACNELSRVEDRFSCVFIEKLKRKARKLSLSTDWMQYINDPVAWVYDHTAFPKDEQLAPYQENALASIIKHKRVSLRGPRGFGKTALAALAVLWFGCTRPFDTKIPTTASSWKQLEKFLDKDDIEVDV